MKKNEYRLSLLDGYYNRYECDDQKHFHVSICYSGLVKYFGMPEANPPQVEVVLYRVKPKGKKVRKVELLLGGFLRVHGPPNPGTHLLYSTSCNYLSGRFDPGEPFYIGVEW